MAKIGVFIDGLNGSLPPSFRKKLASAIREFPEIACLIEEEDLLSPEALQRMFNVLKSGGVERLVIIGGSPKRYETSFNKFGFTLPFNPYLFTVANVREHALWLMDDENEALEKAKAITLKALKRASFLRPIEPQSLPLKSEVLIIGGGVTGISIALTLAHLGIRVSLIEKEEKLGGKVTEVWKFYKSEEEVKKWMDQKISEVMENSNITLLTHSRLKRLYGHFGQFQATIVRGDHTELTLTPSAIIVATGYRMEYERTEIYGHKRMILIQEMEKLLEETKDKSLFYDGEKVETVTYLLDAVNEDIKIDSINALRQSLILQGNFHCPVSILCKDLKVSSDGMERLYRKVREQGTLFFKYEAPPSFSLVNGKIRIDLKEASPIQKEDRRDVSILSDLVVRCGVFLPSPETFELSSLLHLNLGTRGFFMDDNPQMLRIRTNRRGIFVAGACRFPQEISETLTEANAVAQEVFSLLSKGTYLYDLSVAEVDPKKCALCYSCARLCPHSAITVEKYAERNVYITMGVDSQTKWGAAKVDPAACFGCGICVGECPAKAITLHHLTDALIYAQMDLPK